MVVKDRWPHNALAEKETSRNGTIFQTTEFSASDAEWFTRRDLVSTGPAGRAHRGCADFIQGLEVSMYSVSTGPAGRAH